MDKRIAQNALNFILSKRFTITGEDFLAVVEVVRELQSVIADGSAPNPRTGILKARVEDPKVQRMLDGIVERVEVLDGLKGDELDRAVTWRHLGDSGFDISVPFGGGVPIIGGTPGTGSGGPVPGPTTAPTNLVVVETFLALMLRWDQPSYNVQHIEIWRSLTDNLSTAQLIGTTVAPIYIDYVGASASFYYWVRAVATDGTYSAYNDPAGTLGTTGLDPSDFELNITISTSNLDAALAARIDLVDFPATGLVDRMAVAEGDIVASESDITALQVEVSGLTTTVGGQTTAINANASSISTNEVSITTLQSDVAGNDSDIASNIANISVNAANILSLEASIGAIDAGGGETWEFIGSLDGWTAANASLIAGGNACVFTPSSSNPNMVGPVISRSGGIYTQVVVRLRQTIGGGSWEGTVFYQTSGHGMVSTHRKTIADPSLSLSQWTTLTWDMSDLTEGGTDWVDSTIEAIRLDLVSDNGGKFEVDFVLIAKFSTSAMSEALAALDVRVTVNEGDISAHATQLSLLEATVNNPTTGVSATSSALSALTVDVGTNETDILANASAIQAVETTVNDGGTGVAANAAAISILETDITNAEGDIVVQAQSITQLVASIEGGFATIVNSLRTVGEGFGTDFDGSEIQSYSVGGRAGASAVISASGNDTRWVRRSSTDQNMRIEPAGVYEVRFSFYHTRAVDEGTMMFAVFAHPTAVSTSNYTVDAITDGVITGAVNPGFMLQATGAVGANEWVDVVCYILGEEVDPSLCPHMIVDGDADNTAGFAVFTDGVRVRNVGPYVRLAFYNWNSSPTYGDDSATTLRVTDLQVRRVDTEAQNHAAISQESTVRATETGELHALWAVKVELSTGGDPYITGFGLASDVIDGVGTSSFGIRADQFFITSPNFGSNPGAGPGDNEESKYPFSIDLINGVAQVGIHGELIVDGTIRANSIIADVIGVRELNIAELYAEFISARTITGQLIRTAESGYRVEIEGAPAAFPIWYGDGLKGATTGLFYVDNQGNVVVKGLLQAGMIQQSYFTPALSNFDSFKIACDYTSVGHPSYYAGLYTGNAAHLNPTLTTGYNAPEGYQTGEICIYNASTSQHRCGYHTPLIRFYSPTHSGSEEYGRLGTLSETLVIRYSAVVNNEFSDQPGWLVLKYRYDGGTERQAFIHYISSSFAGAGSRQISGVAEDIFVTRETPWDYLDIRLGVGQVFLDNVNRGRVSSVNLTAYTSNFGYADLITTQGVTDVTGTVDGTTPLTLNTSILKRYG